MKYFLFFFSLSILACSSEKPENSFEIDRVIELQTPVNEGGEANLFTDETGKIYLSWVEYVNDSLDELRFSVLNEREWSVPQKIASGSDWFVNWADFPSIVAYKDKGQTLAAHWLQKSEKGTYDYDVRIAQSLDSGKSWNPSFIVHKDSIEAEHGFVSMLPLSEDRIFATWLDGRNTKNDKESGKSTAMTLRAATFDKTGKIYDEAELDNRVCDCCQTSAAITDKGVIVAYRDRSDDEIRDIAITRNIDGKWTTPSFVFEDNWHIAGCPVNGASIKAAGKNVAIVWFSRANKIPQVKVAFSKDSGASFSAPIRIDEGEPLGRVDVVLLAENKALVSWVEKAKEGTAEIRAVCVNNTEKVGESTILSKSSASRSSGFPRMAKSGERIFLAWTQVDSILTTIKTAEIISKEKK